MSNRLTFSLASLIFLIALIAMPAMAQENAVSLGTPGSAMAAHGFGVVAADATFTGLPTGVVDVNVGTNLPNLELKLKSGVTIVLAAPINEMRDGDPATANATGTLPAATGGTDITLKDVVISEIMWGLDTNATSFAVQKNQQYIELYSTLADADSVTANVQGVALDNWRLFFYASHPDYLKDLETGNTGRADADKNNYIQYDVDADNTIATTGAEVFVVVDIVSNISTGGYAFDIGQSGALKVDDGATPKNLISAYRNIDYTKVENPKNDRAAQLKDFPNGEAKGSWKASTRLYDNFRVGSPGAEHFKGLSVVAASSVAYAPFVINEFYVDNNNTDYNWIEIRNKDAGEKSLKNYHLSHATAVGTDTSLVNFKDKDIKIPGGGVLLIVTTEPKGDKNHPLAVGVNAETEEGANAEDLEKNGVTSRYIVRDGIKNLPKDKILLILRDKHDGLKSAGNFIDVTGSRTIADTAADYATSLWPLKRTGAPHGDTIDGKGLDFKAGTVYRRAKDGAGWAEHTWAVAGNDGPGYKRAKQGKGTPGYDNGAVKVFDKKSNADDYDAKIHDASKYVSISEIMYQSERNSPQWIELYNSSMTQSVQLDDWQLKLENATDDKGNPPIRKNVTVKLASKVIQPNQTVLIVAFNSNRNSRQFPSDRLIEIWKAGLKDKDKLEITDGTARTNFTFLSETGFKVTLKDKAGNTIDTVGNMGADPAWELPAMSDDGMRASIIRRYNTGDATGTSAGRGSGEGMAQDGTMAVPVGWTVAMAQETYYGNQDDLGSPGYRAGGPLPVSLSKFRPERLESGDIVIRWITESELNNAGFNILRSETRDGAFKQINTSLIAGKGTTSERTTYEWKDLTAKPTVVYYYQIQDVSLDGQVQTLRMSVRLKGDITPAGKLTTTWGELKALQ